MSTILNLDVVNNATNAQDVKDHLLNGAKVIFDSKESMYRIQGVKDLEVSAKGYVVDNGEIKYPKESNDTVYISSRKDFKSINIAYKSLITLLNGYVPKGGVVVKMKELDEGYSPDNIVFVSKFTGEGVDVSKLETIVEHLKKGMSVSSKDNTISDKDRTIVNLLEDKEDIAPESLYTNKATVVEYVTEDEKVFHSLEAAAMHQRVVNTAKEVANVVLEHNKELYGVAEQAFLRLMNYTTGKPYKHFRNVMDNDNGIVERTSKEVVQFKTFLIGQEPKFAYLFSDKSYTQEQADEIVSMLSLSQEVYLQLEGLSKITA